MQNLVSSPHVLGHLRPRRVRHDAWSALPAVRTLGGYRTGRMARRRRPDVNYIRQRFTCSVCGGNAGKQVRLSDVASFWRL